MYASFVHKKARPDLQYSDFNLIPVCQKHHNMFHNKGTKYMADNFEYVAKWLSLNDWEYDDIFDKWFHYKANKETK